MNIELIQGQFSTKNANDIITQMIHIKIKNRKSKISKKALEKLSMTGWKEQLKNRT